MSPTRKAGRLLASSGAATTLRGLLLTIALVSLPSVALGGDNGPGRTAGGITVYLGVTLADTVRGRSPPHTEIAMHGGVPSGSHAYHLMVAIFDAATGARIEDAKVSARVSELGLSGSKVKLEPMRIGDMITYGNYVSLPGRVPYRIDVGVDRPQGTAKFQFMYTPY